MSIPEPIRLARIITDAGDQYIIGKLLSMGDTIRWTHDGVVLTGTIRMFVQRGTDNDEVNSYIVTDKGTIGSVLASGASSGTDYELNNVIGIGATETLKTTSPQPEQIKLGAVMVQRKQGFIIGKLLSIDDAIRWNHDGVVLTGQINKFVKRNESDDLSISIHTDTARIGNNLSNGRSELKAYELKTVIGIGANEMILKGASSGGKKSRRRRNRRRKSLRRYNKK